MTATTPPPSEALWRRVLYVLRHVASVLVLPVTVTILIPLWIARTSEIALTVPRGAAEASVAVAGAASLAVGLLLFASSLRQFFVFGRGTLAPWDPPRRLVVQGPYRYVRNPMISGVIFLLAGTALILRSVPHGGWALTFLAINCVYIPLFEEPSLAYRFGDDYPTYCRHVSRLWPRLTPWDPRSSPDATGPDRP